MSINEECLVMKGLKRKRRKRKMDNVDMNIIPLKHKIWKLET